MSDQRDGGIAWTDQTWNPTRGCTRISEGCRSCYAESVAARFSGTHPTTGEPLAYHGLARQTDHGPRWTGKLVMVPDHLDDPTRWKRPRRIFVNSMSDLFHEKLTDEQIAAVFRVMLNAPRHTFQVLTKRAKRMYEWTRWFAGERGEKLPGHIQLGVSAEDQENADARIPWLLKTEAKVRFVSAEPLIGPINFGRIPWGGIPTDVLQGWRDPAQGIHWVIVGGESGRSARPFDVEWARSIVRQCRAAGAAPFVKQLGGKPFDSTGAWESRDVLPSHGPPIEEWGEDFKDREFPPNGT
jgi:protein gp37